MGGGGGGERKAIQNSGGLGYAETGDRGGQKKKKQKIQKKVQKRGEGCLLVIKKWRLGGE